MKTPLKLGTTVLLGLTAQLQAQDTSTSATDSVVKLVAESDSLQEIPYASLPAHGCTYWEILPGGLTVPLPGPLFDPSLPIYQITPTIFVVDSTFGEILVNPRQSAGLSPTAARTAAANAEATKVSNLITLVQSVSAQTAAAHTMALATTASSSATLLATSDTSGGTLSPNGQQQPQSGVPYLTIAPTGTNGVYLITVLNDTGPANYEIWTTPTLDTPAWTMAAPAGTTGQTNFTTYASFYYTGFYRALWDTNAIPLWIAADPNNPAAGSLTVVIDSPSNGAIIQ